LHNDASSEKITRRQLLKGGAALALTVAVSTLYGCVGGGATNSNISPVSESGSSATATPTPTPAPTPTPVPPPPDFLQPPIRASVNGLLDTTLNVSMATNTVNGQTITTRTFEGMIGGPTLKIKPGDTLRFNMVNNLPPNPDQATVYPDMNTPHHFNSTNNHVHGLHVSPSNNSDNVFVEIMPGESFQYEYKLPLDHPAGTFWYHPHKHGSTSMQLFGGMGAAIIVEGGIDNLPQAKAARDLVYLINELNIDPATGLVPDYLPGVNGNNAFPLNQRIMTVNGQVNPTLTCLPGEVVRLRVINASVRTTVPFFIDGHDLGLVSLDGITLPALRTVTTGVELSPAARADIFFRAQAPGTYLIKKLIDTTNTLPDAEIIIGTLVVAGPQVTMEMPTTLPVNDSLPDIQASEITGTRTLTFAVSNQGGPPGPPNLPGTSYPNFTIDGQRFDPNVIAQNVQLNAVEEWTLVNTSGTGHPFHIHINPFQVVAINGVPLAEPEWHDTINIPKKGPGGNGTVTIRHRFVDYTGLFVLHCHILVHEDIGMMQTVNVM
jgi:FtsP/CotA-like multicopper oxidase with cupredoxin domain